LNLQAMFPFSTFPCRTMFSARRRGSTFLTPVYTFKRHIASFLLRGFCKFA